MCFLLFLFSSKKKGRKRILSPMKLMFVEEVTRLENLLFPYIQPFKHSTSYYYEAHIFTQALLRSCCLRTSNLKFSSADVSCSCLVKYFFFLTADFLKSTSTRAAKISHQTLKATHGTLTWLAIGSIIPYKSHKYNFDDYSLSERSGSERSWKKKSNPIMPFERMETEKKGRNWELRRRARVEGTWREKRGARVEEDIGVLYDMISLRLYKLFDCMDCLFFPSHKNPLKHSRYKTVVALFIVNISRAFFEFLLVWWWCSSKK